jgi:hypothetical protein
MALRQTTGFVESLLRLVGLDWTVAATVADFRITGLRISELPDSDYAKSRTAISVIPGQFGHG